MKLFERMLYYLVCIYIIVLPLIPSQINISYIRIIPNLILLAIMVTFLLVNLKDRSSRKEFLSHIRDFLTDPAGIFFVLLFVFMMLSVSYAADKKLALSESIRFFTYLVLYFTVKYSLRTEDNVKGVIGSYVVVVALISIIGVVQYFTGIGQMNFWNYEISPGVFQNRIFATLENPNNLGAFLELALLPVMMLALSSKNRKAQVLLGLTAALAAFNVYAASSRNAWIGVLVGLAVLAVFYSWKAIAALGAVLGMLLLIPQVSRRFMGALSLSDNSIRLKLWETAVKMFQEHPFTGVGNGNYTTLRDVYGKKYPELASVVNSNFPTHNSYLKVLSELGIFGFSSFLGLIICSVMKLKKTIALSEVKYQKVFFMGFFASCIGFLVMNLFDNMFFVPSTTTYFWIFIALADNLLYKSKLN